MKVHINQENKTIRRIFVMEMKNLHKHNLSCDFIRKASCERTTNSISIVVYVL